MITQFNQHLSKTVSPKTEYYNFRKDRIYCRTVVIDNSQPNEGTMKVPRGGCKSCDGSALDASIFSDMYPKEIVYNGEIVGSWLCNLLLLK